MRFAILSIGMVVCCFVIYPVSGSRFDDTPNTTSGKSNLQLGNFSISLAVKDVNVSKEFYEKLGFKVSGGPAFLTLVDPDGNPVLIDQHVSKPAKK